MIEHVLGCFAEIHDPLAHAWRPDAEGHVLRITSAGGVIIAANTANAAGDEMGIARIFALHENAVTAKNRRGAVTFGDLFIGEIDFRVNAETADDPGDRIPIHFDQPTLRLIDCYYGLCGGGHLVTPFAFYR